MWCVGEGLCPSRGRPQGSPLRCVYRQDFVGGDAHIAPRPLQGVRCGEESPSHGFAVPAPFRQGGRGDGECGLPRARCALAMTEVERICVSFRDQSADWSWESVIPQRKGRGERIATASVRTGFAMTHYKGCDTAGRCRHRPLRKRYKRCGGRDDVSIGPYGWVVGADDPVRPVPITQHLVGQGPCALPWVRGKSGRGAPGKKQNRPRLLPRTMRCTVVPPCFAACSRRRPYEVPLHFRAVTGAPVRA